VLLSARLYEYRLARPGSLMWDKARDVAVRTREHIRIARRVLEFWQERGWLERWPEEIAGWVLDFTLPGAQCQPPAVRASLIWPLSALAREFLGGSTDPVVRLLALQRRGALDELRLAKAVLERDAELIGEKRALLRTLRWLYPGESFWRRGR
jgi:hypothetical protein